MNEIDFAALVDWASAHPGLVIAAGFVLALVEALAVIGIIMPGIFLLFVLGALVGWDPVLLAPVAAAVLAGAIAGDGLSYWLGRRYRDRLHRVWPFASSPHWLEYGESFFRAHGGKSVFLGRFVGPLRPVIPLVAGSLGMPPREFMPRMLVACTLWTPLMLAPGVLFGQSLALAADFGARLTVLLLLLVIGGWLLIWVSRAGYEAAARRAPWWLKNVALWLRRHRLLGRWFGALFEPGRREVLTVTILGLLLVVSLAALFAALLLAPLSSSAWSAGFELSGLAASLRSHFADPLFFVILLATSQTLLALLIAVMAAILLFQRRWNGLLHWLLATLGGWFLALLLNSLMGMLLDRPPLKGSVGEVPNVHFTLAVLVFGFASLIVAKDLRPRQRKWLYLSTVCLLALIGFADFYLARATVNGLLSALALALGWMAFTGIAYRIRATPNARPGRLLAVWIFGWLGLAALIVPAGYRQFADAHELTQPSRTMAVDEWLQGAWRELPSKRSRIGPAEAQRFDAQLAVSRDRLAAALRANGWRVPSELRLDTAASLFNPDAPIAERVVLPRDFAGKTESLLFRRPNGGRAVTILRAWDSGLRLGRTEVPVWLVQIEQVEPTVRFGFVNGWTPSAGTTASLAPLKDLDPEWRWMSNGSDDVALVLDPTID